MRFTLAAALLATSALAAPRPQATDEPNPVKEVVTVSALSGFKAADGKFESMTLKLAGDDGDVDCANDEGQRPNVVSACGESKYRFVVPDGASDESNVNITIYHEKGTAWGFWGVGTVPVYCRTAGGDRRICDQVQDSVDIELRF